MINIRALRLTVDALRNMPYTMFPGMEDALIEDLVSAYDEGSEEGVSGILALIIARRKFENETVRDSDRAF